ncbi:MAG TPA: RpiB/LacA/LacB family sugar-phosphate isomerase [Acidimicrobiales bacterium]|nr:RpiB/LacA/LacB family sugar-phosphate isomerase [Acidimicrobiales bacterium]
MRIAYGTDEMTPVTRAIAEHLREAGHQVDEVAKDDEWPEVGRQVGEAVASGQADRGIVWCFTGTGVSIAANKVSGVRAALCLDAATAAGARRWNDANVLALGLRVTAPTVAEEIVGAFLETDVDPAERAAISRVEPSPIAP